MKRANFQGVKCCLVRSGKVSQGKQLREELQDISRSRNRGCKGLEAEQAWRFGGRKTGVIAVAMLRPGTALHPCTDLHCNPHNLAGVGGISSPSSQMWGGRHREGKPLAPKVAQLVDSLPSSWAPEPLFLTTMWRVRERQAAASTQTSHSLTAGVRTGSGVPASLGP